MTTKLPQQTVQKKGFTFRDLTPYLYIVPSLALFILFVFYPFVKTIYLSLSSTDLNGNATGFVGLANYITAFQDKTMWTALWVTIKYALMVVAGSIVMGTICAILANESFKGRGLVRTVYAMPMAISSACIAVIATFILNPTMGILNQLLGTQIKWLKGINTALPSVAVVTIWMNIGMNYLFVIAALQSVDISLYEAGSIEGVNFFQKHWYITIPSISPTLFFLLIINVINSFQAYAQIRLMTQGGPGKFTTTLVYMIYRETFENMRYASGATMSVILFVILFILTAIQFKVEKKVTY
ncbi:MAG: carbohydrate ABC transporter permease [Candidatus Faecivicinus sp.]